MRHVISVALLALVTCLVVACGGSDARGQDQLFDTTRTDVVSFKGEDGRTLGLVNTTHGVLWDYEKGYTGFTSNKDVAWGPLPSVPEGQLQSMQGGDVPGVGGVSTDLGTISGGGGHGITICTCCYWRIDKTCGCLECRSF